MEGGGISPGLGPASAGDLLPGGDWTSRVLPVGFGYPHLLMPAVCPAGAKSIYSMESIVSHFAEQVSTVLVPFSHRRK